MWLRLATSWASLSVSDLDPQKVLFSPLGRQLTLEGLKGTVSYPSLHPPGAERQEGRAGLLPSCPRLSPGETVVRF